MEELGEIYWEDIPATNPMGQVSLIMLLLAMVS